MSPMLISGQTLVGMWDRVFHQNELLTEEPKVTRSQVFLSDLRAIGGTLKACLIHGMVKDIHAVRVVTLGGMGGYIGQ